MKTFFNKLVISCCIALTTSYAFADQTTDPYEGFNRHVYQFNKTFDYYLLKPAATVYKSVLPNPVIKGIGNFFCNLNQIPVIGNDLLQGQFYQATGDSWRLLINSTAGLLGFFDVAGQIGLPKHSQDFGLTLAKWGYHSSNYLVLPFFGPSTVRDAVGLTVDYNALSVYPYVNPKRDRYVLLGTNTVNQRANMLNFDNVLQQAALDEYTFVRNAYLQKRSYKIQKVTHTLPPDDEDSGI